MASGLERLAMFVGPGVLGQVAALLKHRIGIPVLGLLGKPVTTLDHQNPETGGCQHPRQGAATGTAANDHHIKMLTVVDLQLFGPWQG